MQRGGVDASASVVPAFRADLPREALVRTETSRDPSAAVLTGRGVAGHSHSHAAVCAGE